MDDWSAGRIIFRCRRHQTIYQSLLSLQILPITLVQESNGRHKTQDALRYFAIHVCYHLLRPDPTVRLGKSGLKVSKIILGTMQYGSSDWQKWVLGEEEAIKHIKFA